MSSVVRAIDCCEGRLVGGKYEFGDDSGESSGLPSCKGSGSPEGRWNDDTLDTEGLVM